MSAHDLQLPIDIDYEQIESFCRRWNLTELGVFGSILRPDFHLRSDVDGLFVPAEGTQLSLFDMVEMREELSAIFGRPVDIGTRRSVETDPNLIRRRSIMDGYRVLHAE